MTIPYSQTRRELWRENKTVLTDFNWRFATLELFIRTVNIIFSIDMSQKCCSREYFFVKSYTFQNFQHKAVTQFSVRIEKLVWSCWKTFQSFASLTRKIFFNTRREIAYLQAVMWYPLEVFSFVFRRVDITFKCKYFSFFSQKYCSKGNLKLEPYIFRKQSSLIQVSIFKYIALNYPHYDV